MLEDCQRAHRVERAALGRLDGKHSGSEAVVRTLERAREIWVDADTLAERRTEVTEERTVMASDVENATPRADPPGRLHDTTVANESVESVHRSQRTAPGAGDARANRRWRERVVTEPRRLAEQLRLPGPHVRQRSSLRALYALRTTGETGRHESGCWQP